MQRPILDLLFGGPGAMMPATGSPTRLPARVKSGLGRLLLKLPDNILERFFSGVIGYTSADVPAPLQAPQAPVRLLIAPANYAAQGYAWARAAETLEGVGAINLHVTRGLDRGFMADAVVDIAVFQKSHRWGRAQERTVADAFTHVLIEAERPILGRRYDGDVRREVSALRAAGLTLGFVSHGSDLRLPSRHAELEEWSPFRDTDWELVPVLERVARDNARLLVEFDLPVFGATPELTADHPSLTWLPNVVSPKRFAVSEAPLRRRRLRVIHAPTNPVIKGTHLIEPAVERLHDAGRIEFRRIEGVPSQQMPALYASSDVVLEQFRLGIYSTTAIEAMAAGRLVVGYLSDGVRSHIRRVTGREVPIVQATPETIEEVLRRIVAQPESFEAVAREGIEYVRAVHDGRFSGRVLASFLGASRRDGQ